MRMLPSHSGRQSAASGASAVTSLTSLCLLLACLAGCASKNPLMEEPVASRAQDTRTEAQAAPASASSAAPIAPAASAASSAAPSAAAQDASGVQTIKQRRFLGFLSPYRADIQQGNFVSREMVAQLKPGMTPDQVRFVLGTPLLTDIFHADRWDYPFRLQKGNGEITSSRVTVFFKDNRLDHFEGGDLPTEKDYLARLAGNEPVKKALRPEEPAVPASRVPPSPAKDPRDPATAPAN